MQDLLKNYSDNLSSASCIGGYPSWQASTELQVENLYLSSTLSLKIESAPPHCNGADPLGFKLQGCDSSSTQSTGQSYPEVVSAGASYQTGHEMFPFQSGYNGNHLNPEEGGPKSSLSTETKDYVLPTQIDHRWQYACATFPYADPYYHGLLNSYGPQAMVGHPQLMAMGSSRVPLPPHLSQVEPIYVNARQYHAILRRRQCRAKLESQNKLLKPKKASSCVEEGQRIWWTFPQREEAARSEPCQVRNWKRQTGLGSD